MTSDPDIAQTDDQSGADRGQWDVDPQNRLPAKSSYEQSAEGGSERNERLPAHCESRDRTPRLSSFAFRVVADHGHRIRKLRRSADTDETIGNDEPGQARRPRPHTGPDRDDRKAAQINNPSA